MSKEQFFDDDIVCGAAVATCEDLSSPKRGIDGDQDRLFGTSDTTNQRKKITKTTDPEIGNDTKNSHNTTRREVADDEGNSAKTKTEFVYLIGIQLWSKQKGILYNSSELQITHHTERPIS